MKITIVIASVILLAACNNASEYDHGKKDNVHDHGNTTMVLNKEQKWKLDDATRENVGQMKELVASEKDLQKLGEQLQLKTDEMIQECRMKGPDHDALHVWLEDYLKDLKAFKEDANARDKNLPAIQEDFKEFDQTFE